VGLDAAASDRRFEALFDSRNTEYRVPDKASRPSNLATMALPETGDRPGSGSIGSFMAGVVFLKLRGWLRTTQTYAKSEI